VVSRTRWFYTLVPVLFLLSACTTAGANPPPSATGTPSSSGGSIGLAVSKTCAEMSDPQCVSVNGEDIVRPSAFDKAGVDSATVDHSTKQDVVDVTFDKDGAAILHTLTKQAMQDGSTARLIVEIGGNLKAAVTVLHTLDGPELELLLAPDDNAKHVVQQISAG